MSKIGPKLDLLKAAFPRVNKGMYLHRDARDLTRRFKTVRVWILLTDGERSALRAVAVHGKLAAWEAWYASLFGGRLAAILPKFVNTMNERHSGAWRVQRVIGWAGGESAERAADQLRPTGHPSRAQLRKREAIQ